jgi:hypothetical protein
VHRSYSKALDGDIVAVKQKLINQDPSRSIWTLKISAEELKKVLKEVVKPCFAGGQN